MYSPQTSYEQKPVVIARTFSKLHLKTAFFESQSTNQTEGKKTRINFQCMWHILEPMHRKSRAQNGSRVIQKKIFVLNNCQYFNLADIIVYPMRN